MVFFRRKFIYLAAVMLAASPSAHGSDKRELGWIEKVTILPENLTLRAKLDTGANTSSINANRLTRFERKGRPWVRFFVSDNKGNATMFERPVVRVVRIKRSDSPTKVRPVVMLTICLGGQFREETVTLTNRSHLNYALLVGRTSMEERFVVNPSRKFTQQGDCFGG